jgi:hypothetical protein
MWCAHCQAEVAAEVTPDNRRVLCASCGRELVASPSAPPDDKTRQALELLERWSSTRLLEPYGSASASIRPAADDPSARPDDSAPHATIPTPAATLHDPRESGRSGSEHRDPLRTAIPDAAATPVGRAIPSSVGSAGRDVAAPPAGVRFDAPHPNAAISPRRLREAAPPRAGRGPVDASGPIGVLEPPRGNGPSAPSSFADRHPGDAGLDQAPPSTAAPEPITAPAPHAMPERIAAPVRNAIPESMSWPEAMGHGAAGGDVAPPLHPPAAAERFDPRPRIHAAHELPAAPHFDVQVALRARQQQRTNWMALAGQLLAYGGVAVLAVGAALVVFGYFGERDDLAPTGWLVTTAGQMLLFLGIVTLVSGGMEQTSQEVTQRIEVLGEHILRIEHATRSAALRGPRIAPQSYADPGAIPQTAAHRNGVSQPGAFDG